MDCIHIAPLTKSLYNVYVWYLCLIKCTNVVLRVKSLSFVYLVWYNSMFAALLCQARGYAGQHDDVTQTQQQSFFCLMAPLWG